MIEPKKQAPLNKQIQEKMCTKQILRKNMLNIIKGCSSWSISAIRCVRIRPPGRGQSYTFLSDPPCKPSMSTHVCSVNCSPIECLLPIYFSSIIFVLCSELPKLERNVICGSDESPLVQITCKSCVPNMPISLTSCPY